MLEHEAILDWSANTLSFINNSAQYNIFVTYTNRRISIIIKQEEEVSVYDDFDLDEYDLPEVQAKQKEYKDSLIEE